ncbi:MAG: sigma-54 dependent transcriptional regulator [Verrucomicrobiota bacterium]
MAAKPHILLVDDEPTTQFGFCRYLTKAGYEIRAVSTLAEAREAVFSGHYDAVLLDLHLPDGNGMDWVEELRQAHPSTAIVVITGSGDIPLAVRAMQHGADQFLAKPVNMAELEVFLRKGLELETLRRGTSIRRRLAKKEHQPFFGESPLVKKALELATMAAGNDSAVVLRGETGTGKGVLARWIHEHSPHSAMPFVEVNCSSLKGDLLASELFGHARGAFTSAVEAKQGLLEVADGATLFLDEIGDMDLGVQATFLKVIEEKEFRRVGEVRVRRSEFRLICATNHDLEEASRQDKFRRDLYFRINVFPIEVPALRETREDIPGLVQYLLRVLAPHDVAVPPDVMGMLTSYSWPGNIRELRNVLERALLLARGQPLAAQHFPGLAAGAADVGKSEAAMSIAELETAQIKAAMERLGGDTKKVAEALGISRATLYRRLKDLRLTP